jgi:hypothetical protein
LTDSVRPASTGAIDEDADMAGKIHGISLLRGGPGSETFAGTSLLNGIHE